MLTRLVLQNIAIIEDLELEFREGLNAITGETGSGKSLILDSIQRVFEKRGSPKDLLRHGATRGRVELTFDLRRIHNRPLVQALLNDAGVELLPEEADLVLSRDITLTGSRSRINGYQVPQDLMERLGNLVLEIYGQHDLHTLFSSARQRELLDNMGGDPLQRVRQEVRRSFRETQQLRTEVEAIRAQQQEWERQRDFLTFQVQEIAQAEIQDPKEDEALQLERERLSHCETLRRIAIQSAYVLTGEDHFETPSVLKLLGQLQKNLSTGTSIDPVFERWSETVAGLNEEFRDLAHELSSYGESLDTRPERMQEIVDRLDTLEKLKRKYGGTLETVLKTAAQLEAELDSLQLTESRLSELEAQLLQTETRYQQLSKTLTELRQCTAIALETDIQKELQALMLPAAQFQIQLQPILPSENGQEQVIFMFSANPGEPLKPLAQVASGGELARLMLALKIQTAHADSLTTLILDEIDTGMSGITVRSVAEKLQALQTQCQIIVITHQPILAAKAPWHLHVQKHLRQDKVEVTVMPLVQPNQRKAVLSQLASGFTKDDAVTAQFVEQLLV